MKRVLTILTACLLFMMSAQISAQTRYLDDVFTTVNRTDSVVYGANISVLTMGLQDLIMDVYMPAGDTATDRPAILNFSTGNFLPRILNGSPYGTIKDSADVEWATRMALKGYVVFNAFYRQGWDATNPDQGIQTATLLQAAYRGQQDCRALARFLRKDVAENGNTYGIDPTKFVASGFGTGGYVALAAGYLDKWIDITLPKFSDFMTGQPYVDSTVHGNIRGTNMTSLNVPNHVGYNDDVQAVINIGGALGDSTWIDAGEPPFIGFHTPQDANAPYDIGVVIVPTTGNTVIDNAAGSYAIGRISNRLGNNDVFVNAGIMDAYTDAANKNNDGFEGLFPFDRPFDPMATWDCGGTPIPLTPEGNPWAWYDEANFIATWDAATGGMPVSGFVLNCSERAGAPDMSPTTGRAYMDSVIGYSAPRLYAALNLAAVNVDEKLNASVRIYPNPATSQIQVRLNDAVNQMQRIELYDVTGKLLAQDSNVFGRDYTFDRNGLASGVYILKVQTDQGAVNKKVVFE